MGPGPTLTGFATFKVFTLCLTVGSWIVGRGAAQCIPTTVEAKVPGLAVPYLSACLNGSYSLKFADGVSSHTVVVTIQSPSGQTVALTGNLNSPITTLTVGQSNGLASTCQGLGVYARSETAPPAGAAAALVLKKPSGGLLKQSALTGEGGRTAVATCLGPSNQYELLLSGAGAPLPGSIFVQAFLTATVCAGLTFDTTPNVPISLVPGQASVIKPSFNPPPNPSATAVNLGPSATFTGPGFTITRPIQNAPGLNQTLPPTLPGEPRANTANTPTNPVNYKSTPGTFPPTVDPRTGLLTPGGPVPVGTNPGGNPSQVTGGSPNPVPQGNPEPQSVSDARESRKWVAIVVPMLVICLLTSVVGGLVFFFGLRNVRRTVTEQMAELRSALVRRSRSASPRDYRRFPGEANQGRVNGVNRGLEDANAGRERDSLNDLSNEYDDPQWGAADVADSGLGRSRFGLSRNQSGFGQDQTGFGRDESSSRQNGLAFAPPRRGVRPTNAETTPRMDRGFGQPRRLEGTSSQLPGFEGEEHVADSRSFRQGSAKTVGFDLNGSGRVRAGDTRGSAREGGAESKWTRTFPAAEEAFSKLFSWARKPAESADKHTAPLLPNSRDPLTVGHVYVPSQPSWNHRTKPQTSAATDAVAARSTEDDVTRTRAQESGLEAARHSLSDLEEGALAEHHAGGLIGGAKLTPLERERPTYLGRGAERSSGAGQGGASGTSAGRGLFRSKSGVPVPLAKQDSLGRANGTEPERRDGRVSEAESDEEPLGDLEGGRSGVVIRGLGPIEDSGLRGGFARNGRYHHKMGGSFGKPDRRRSVDSQSLGSTVTKRVSDVGRHVGGGKGATLLSKDWAVNENETGDERREAKGEGLRFETEGLREEGKGLDVGKKLEKQPRGGQDGLGQANGELGGENWHKEENAGEGLEGGSGRQSSQETRIGRRNSVALSGEGFRSGVVYASPDPVKTESFNKVREWFSRGDHGERADFSAAKRNGAEQHSTERNGVARSGMERKRTELRRAGIDVKGGEGGSRRQVAFESKESERREVRSGNGIGRYSVQQTEQNPPEAEYWETESLLFGKRPPRWDTSPYKAAHVAQVSETRNESRARELSTTRATFSNDKPTGPGGSLRGRSGDTWQATRGGGDLVRARERVAEELEAGGWSPDRADVEMVDCLLFDLPEMVASVQNFRSQLE